MNLKNIFRLCTWFVIVYCIVNFFCLHLFVPYYLIQYHKSDQQVCELMKFQTGTFQKKKLGNKFKYQLYGIAINENYKTFFVVTVKKGKKKKKK